MADLREEFIAAVREREAIGAQLEALGLHRVWRVVRWPESEVAQAALVAALQSFCARVGRELRSG